MKNVLRKKPHALVLLECLDRRTTNNYPQKKLLQNELRKREAGYQGEKNLDFAVSRLPFPMHYFTDLYFPSLGLTQVDSVLFLGNKLFVLESKHLSGLISYDIATKTLKREYNQKVEYFSDPIAQVNFAAMQLERVISKVTHNSITVEGIAVLTSKSSVVTSSLPLNFCRLEHLYQSIISKLDTTDLLVTDHTISTILKLSKPMTSNVLDQFEYVADSLRKGIICPLCLNEVKVIKYSPVNCCSNKDTDLFLSSLIDYAILINPHPLTSHLSEFLLLRNRQQLTRLLKSHNIPTYNQSRATRADLTKLTKI